MKSPGRRPHLWFVCPQLGVANQAWIARQIERISAFDVTVLCWIDQRTPAEAARQGWNVVRLAHPFSPIGKWQRRWHLARRLPLGNVLATAGAERRDIEALASRRPPDVMLCHFGWTALRLLPVAERLGVPLVAHYHGRDLTLNLRDRWYRRSLVRNLPRIAAHVAVGSSQRRWLEEHGARPLHVIPCGAPIADLTPAPEPDGRMRFVTVGRLHPRKGAHIAIDAFGLASKSLESAELRIVGGGGAGYRSKLEDRVSRLDLGDRVTFTGPVPPERVRDELAAASVLLHPAIDINGESEGFGVSITEASAMERPVIVSDSGGIPDQVIDGVTGIICPQGDVDAVAQAMIRLGHDDDLRRRMGAAGRQNVVTNFDTAGQVAKLEEVLWSVLRTPTRGLGAPLPPES
jgi:glycosyltransferase involved in cell wall biosynthesis